MQKPKCEKKDYGTSISAIKALKKRGEDPAYRIQRCPNCRKWHIKEK